MLDAKQRVARLKDHIGRVNIHMESRIRVGLLVALESYSNVGTAI